MHPYFSTIPVFVWIIPLYATIVKVKIRLAIVDLAATSLKGLLNCEKHLALPSWHVDAGKTGLYVVGAKHIGEAK